MLEPKLENVAKLLDVPFKGLVTNCLDKLPLSDFRLASPLVLQDGLWIELLFPAGQILATIQRERERET